MAPATPNKPITEALAAPFDQSLIEQKQGKSYISQEHVRQRLIDATDNHFDFAIQSIEYRNDGALKDRTNRETGEITLAPPVCVVVATLTIPGLGSRTDVGVQEMESGSGADAAYKGAASDALKRCAMSFGVGLKQLYIDKGRPPQQPARPVPEPPPDITNTAKGSASTQQLRAMFALAKTDLKMTDDQIKQELSDGYGVTSSKDLSAKQCSEYIAFLRSQTREQPGA